MQLFVWIFLGQMCLEYDQMCGFMANLNYSHSGYLSRIESLVNLMNVWKKVSVVTCCLMTLIVQEGNEASPWSQWYQWSRLRTDNTDSWPGTCAYTRHNCLPTQVINDKPTLFNISRNFPAFFTKCFINIICQKVFMSTLQRKFRLITQFLMC